MNKQARIRAQQIRQARERTARRTRIMLLTGSAAIVALLIAIIAVVASSGPKGDAANGSGPSTAAPANATASGAIVLGRADAPVKLEIYLDYMCPYCGRFEKTDSGDIAGLVDAGKVRLELHPLAFLDRMSSGTKYSTRAANAVATVADRSPASVLAFSSALFAAQPAEGSTGLTDERIAALALQAGVPQEVADAFAARTFESWVTSATQAAVQAGITGTPTVKIDGVVFQDLYTTGALKNAVAAAEGRR